MKSKDAARTAKVRDDSVISIDPLNSQLVGGLSPELTQQYRRVVYGRAPLTAPHFATNEIHTSRYTLLTWAPKSLLYQFRRSANIYFLVISILTMMSFSPKNPFSMAGTFTAVLVFTMLKEAYEDYFRHVQDRKVNRTVTRVFDKDSETFREMQWRHVRVGDILEVREGEMFPADLIFLSSSNSSGLAFVNTMNLDGETNLKEKIALDETKNFQIVDFRSAVLDVATDTPNLSLIKWNCNLSINGSAWVAMTQNQLLLRSCQLKNTEKIFGLVIYAGKESKVMLNSKHPPAKVSNVMRLMNKMLYTVYLMQFCICAGFAGLSLYWNKELSGKHEYLGDIGDGKGGTFAIQVLTFYVAYSHLIPISLYVALEIVKLACSYLIRQDLQMYYSPDDRPASTRTSDLVEELGQVEFLFSDKTGTLTQNVMKFKKCSVNGIMYGSVEGIGNLPGQDQRPIEVLTNSHPGNEDLAAMSIFLRHMSLCHSVFPTDNPVKGRPPLYQASSPDELALVAGAASLGFVFSEKTTSTLTTRNWGQDKQSWEVLAEIPFNSNRKRMSIILKEPGTHRILLLSKGADQVMLPLLRPRQSLQPIVQDHLHEFAVEGLRTLVMCQRYLQADEFSLWYAKWKQLQLSNSVDKDAMMDDLGAEVEIDLDLIGASAIEDKLQVGVPETITVLMAAGIRVWVLTGDKQETAIEIGKACNLITKDMKLLDLSCGSQAQLVSLMNVYTQQYVLFTQNLSSKSIDQLSLQKQDPHHEQLGIVIDGVSLTWAINDSLDMRQRFFKLGYLSDSCICCRVSPSQKMQIVQLAKENGPWITLAVGDGANDVSMIQEAHIGVGIAGKEGTQAVQCSDYALSQFRFLQRLLLVHGRWGYRRISWFICYYFYKNITVVITELCFAFMNGLSGQIYFLDWLPMLYNAFWTSWPCMFTFVFEQDLNDEECISYASTYQVGANGKYFTFRVFWLWVAASVWHGLICFWLPFKGLEFAVNKEGLDTGLWWVSTVSFTVIIHVITFKLFIESIYWTKVNM